MRQCFTVQDKGRFAISLVAGLFLTGCMPQKAAPLNCDFPDVVLEDLEVKDGRAIGHAVFKITNTTGAPIHVKKVVPSCGCSKVAMADTIPPFSETPLRMDIEYDADPPTSKKVQIVVQYGNGKPNDLLLSVTATPKLEANIRGGAEIDTGKLFQGQKTSYERYISVPTWLPFDIGDVKISTKLAKGIDVIPEVELVRSEKRNLNEKSVYWSNLIKVSIGVSALEETASTEARIKCSVATSPKHERTLVVHSEVVPKVIAVPKSQSPHFLTEYNSYGAIVLFRGAFEAGDVNDIEVTGEGGHLHSSEIHSGFAQAVVFTKDGRIPRATQVILRLSSQEEFVGEIVPKLE